MNFNIEHLYINMTDSVRIVTINSDTKRATYSSSGELPIRHPGALNIATFASFYIHMKVDPTGPGGPGHPHPPTRPLTQQVPLHLTVKVFSPDGVEHTTGFVTLDDLSRFRDLRNASHANWTYEVSGQSAPIFVGAEDGSVSTGDVGIIIALEENVPSQSAGLLVNSTVAGLGPLVFSFDLFRVGMFDASVQSTNLFVSWNGLLRLKNPDGTEVAASANGHLTFPVTLQTINQSRDATGQVRLWSLEVDTATPFANGSAIRATVIATTRIPVAIFQDRINDLIGVNGSNLSIYGENKNGRALGRLEILDEFSAETIDMHGLLDSVLKKTTQDDGIDISDIHADVVYNIANRKESMSFGLSMDVSSMKVNAIKINVGASQHIQPSIPAVTVELDVQGGIDINLGSFTLITVSVNDNRIILETGAKLDGSGNLVTVPWMNDDPIELSINWEAALLAGLITGAIADLGLIGLESYVESEVNNALTDKFRSIVEDAIFQAPKIMAMLLGANFTLTSLRMDNDAIVIDYVAPVEPDPKPSHIYTPIIGRSATKLGPGLWQIFPRSLGNTWANANLSKVDHIVVVMMENRAFDHVLGYRAQSAAATGENGLSQELIDFLQPLGFPIGKLSDSGIVPNAEGLKTRFPASVGHRLADVAQQLSQRLQTPAGMLINSPQGFVDDFAARVVTGLVKEDVLGYYTDSDLIVYKFLAENYSYCERYFSAHPGPTLPNRMYSLAGDVQYDRVGEAILDNNNGDNFALSRALNIFDILTKKSVSWRVYESFPSITMLRMFARYAPDTTNIVPITQLEQDIAAGNLPSVTFIDPAMHSAPENDDHPPADMLYGQIFLKRLYDALHSNPALWLKTLFVVTYDEHGGFYDHVIPSNADALSLPPVLTAEAGVAPTASFKDDMMIPYGLRVPTFVISPWVPAGKGPDITLDHCSILKTILARFCNAEKPFLTDRVATSQTFESLLSANAPRVSEIPRSPTLPTPFLPKRPLGSRAIITKPLSRKAMREGDAEFHDLTGMLARMLGRH